MRTRARGREYRDSSLKIQMEYRAFEERSPNSLSPREGVRGRAARWWVLEGRRRTRGDGGLAADEEDSAGTGDEGDISKIEY